MCVVTKISAFINNHGRYKFITVSLLMRSCNGRFRNEAANWIQKWCEVSAGASREPHCALDITFFKAEMTGAVTYSVRQKRLIHQKRTKSRARDSIIGQSQGGDSKLFCLEVP